MEYKYEMVDAGGSVVCSEGGKRKVSIYYPSILLSYLICTLYDIYGSIKC